LKIEQAYIIGRNWACFQYGVAGKIIGIRIITPDKNDPRPCFEVEYPNGAIDYIPISEADGAYSIKTLQQVSAAERE